MLAAHLALVLVTQSPTGPTDLTNPIPTASDGFGSAVAIEGDLAVVGARDDVGSATAAYGPGTVTVFRRIAGAWSQEARLTASDGATRDAFGASVAVDRRANGRDVIVVGAPGRGSGSFDSPGSAYVFERGPGGAWFERARFDGDPTRERFGWDVAVEDGVAAIGQPDFIGTVHLVERTPSAQWTSTGAASRPATVFDGAEFGEAVAMDGPLLVVGAPGEDAQSYDSGATYVYRRGPSGSHALESRLEHPSAFVVTYHGHDVAVDVDGGVERIAVGSLDRRAFVWIRSASGWVDVEELAPFDGDDEGFGETVAVSGSRVVVGALRRLGASSSSGAAFEFVANGSGWTPRSLIVEAAAGGSTAFAASLALDGSTLLVGAPQADAPSADSGAALVYDVDRRLGKAYCVGRPGSSGATATLVPHGSVDAAADDLAFDVFGMPAGTYGYLLASGSRDQVPGLGGGFGDLCLGGPISRIISAAGNADGSGRRTFAVPSAGLPPSLSFTPGTRLAFQYWFRDADGGVPSTNTTHAVELVFE
ncbi:MAG: hypothetical protein AAF726_05410 [Planctomycetota bacterium]